MFVENEIDAYYNIKCEKCGETIEKHKTYCKQYGDEYRFNPPLVCPTCGNTAKTAYLAKDFIKIQANTMQNSQISVSKSLGATESTEKPTEQKFTNAQNPSNNKMSFIESLKYVKNINQHIDETAKLNKRLQAADETIIQLQADNEELKSQLDNKEAEKAEVQALLTDEHYQTKTVKEYLDELCEQEAKAKHEISMLEAKVEDLSSQVIELDDELLYQSFGLYKPLFDFANSALYKERLDNVRQQQKEMIKSKSAVSSITAWTVNGSKAQGTKMTNDNIKQILRCFNSECENVIDRVKFNNYESMKSRITKTFETLNKLNDVNSISIEQSFLELKYEELDLAYEYQAKKQEEKEELRILREQQREDAKVAKEIEEKRREIEKEQQHYENALNRLQDQIEAEKNEERLQFLLEKKKEIEENLVDLDIALKEVDYREANQRAGYVYVISNIGAFGENVYKIGMTRRLDPQDRVDELGNASVPFRYDIHAMIFSDDAPKLESALHRAFEQNRINAVNSRKEFFRVSIGEIEKVVDENHDKTVDFINVPSAQQFRESLKLRGSGCYTSD